MESGRFSEFHTTKSRNKSPRKHRHRSPSPDNKFSELRNKSPSPGNKSPKSRGRSPEKHSSIGRSLSFSRSKSPRNKSSIPCNKYYLFPDFNNYVKTTLQPLIQKKIINLLVFIDGDQKTSTLDHLTWLNFDSIPPEEMNCRIIITLHILSEYAKIPETRYINKFITRTHDKDAADISIAGQISSLICCNYNQQLHIVIVSGDKIFRTIAGEFNCSFNGTAIQVIKDNTIDFDLGIFLILNSPYGTYSSEGDIIKKFAEDNLELIYSSSEEVLYMIEEMIDENDFYNFLNPIYLLVEMQRLEEFRFGDPRKI